MSAMPNEYKCESHRQLAIAYCKVHRITLCTKCLIENTHKDTNCNVCELRDITGGEAVYLDIQNVKEIIATKEENIIKEREALEELQRSLQIRVESLFTKLVEKLDDKKNKTTALLKRNIDRKRSFNNVQSENLAKFCTEISKYADMIEELDRKDPVIDFCDVRADIANFKAKIEELSVNILGIENGSFIPCDTEKVFSSKEENLGYFDFDDDIYVEPEDENLEPNEEDLASSDMYETLSNVSSIVIRSEDKLPGKYSQIRVLKDDRILLLDSLNGEVLIVDNEGTIIRTLVENGDGRAHSVSCSCSFVKKEHKIALLGFDDTGPYLKTFKFLANDTFQIKHTFRLTGPLQKYERDVQSFVFDESSSICAIILKDRVIHLHKDKVVNFHSLNTDAIGNTVDVEMTYDFNGDSVYILNKDSHSIKRYDCKTSSVKWRKKLNNDSKSLKPLGMSLDRTSKKVVIICAERILCLEQSDGKVAEEKSFKFHSDMLAFCFKGNDVLTSRGSGAGGRLSAQTIYLHSEIRNMGTQKRYTRSHEHGYQEIKVVEK